MISRLGDKGGIRGDFGGVAVEADPSSSGIKGGADLYRAAYSGAISDTGHRWWAHERPLFASLQISPTRPEE
jgi:hypothetical protein